MKIESLGGAAREVDEEGELVAAEVDGVDVAARGADVRRGGQRAARGADAGRGKAKVRDGTARVPGQLIITDIRQGVKNPNRANIFINGKFSFSLDITQLVDYRLKTGKLVSDEELEEFKKASEFGKLYQRTLEWVLARPRSEKEARDYLRRKIYEKKLNPDYQERILARLVEKKYLDDAKFAEFYVENRFVKKGVSRKRLKMELRKKGVSEDVIEEVLEGSERDDATEIRKMIARKRGRYDAEKLIQYLCRQGFSYSLVKEIVSEEL